MQELRVLSSEEGTGPVRIGFLEINAPETLGALNTNMLKKIELKLKEWLKRPDIGAVVFYSKSDRAFSAGGDVKNLVKAFMDSGSETIAREFFTTEYFTDYFIHTYPKPTICFADGVTMGGGIGVMNGCRYRLVTERTLMAMPEISIGLFPDVGGGYFLNHLKLDVGLFLGLTGARFKAGDALIFGLADYFFESKSKKKVFVDLQRLPLTEDLDRNHKIINSYFLSSAKNSLAPRDWHELDEKLIELSQSPSLEAFEDQLLQQHFSHKSYQASKAYYQKGSPLSRRLIFEGLKKMKRMTLKEVFLTEWNMAIECSLNKDFTEGVRALLIDKDQMPNWEYKTNPAADKVEPYFKNHTPHLLFERFSQELC